MKDLHYSRVWDLPVANFVIVSLMLIYITLENFAHSSMPLSIGLDHICNYLLIINLNVVLLKQKKIFKTK